MINVEKLAAEVQRQYIAATEGLSNRRLTFPDFRVDSVRLVKWANVLLADAFPDGDEEAIAANVVGRIIDFERGLMVGAHAERPSSVARCFLRGHEVPDVFPVARTQIKIRHVFGVER